MISGYMRILNRFGGVVHMTPWNLNCWPDDTNNCAQSSPRKFSTDWTDGSSFLNSWYHLSHSSEGEEGGEEEESDEGSNEKDEDGVEEDEEDDEDEDEEEEDLEPGSTLVLLYPRMFA